MNISKLMTREVRTVNPHDSLHAAANIMWERDCGIVPVVDDNQRLLGVVTDRDLCMAAWSRDRRLAEIQVEDTMSREVKSCQQHDSLESVLTQMRAHRVRRLPVVDRELRLVGMLSINDLVRVIDADKDVARRRSEAEEFVHALAGVCTAHCDPIPPAEPISLVRRL